MNVDNPLALLRTQSLTTLVHDELEKQIAIGQLQPDMPLREVAIATEMGISRGPVREAFRVLEERGLVVFEKNCGVRVRKLDLTQAAQIYQVRIPLETLIGQLVAARCNPDIAKGLNSILAQMRDSVERDDVANYSSLNFRFHDFLAKSAGNTPLYDIYRRLVVQLTLFRHYTFRHDPQSIGQSWREHSEIATVIATGDAAKAGELLCQHAQSSLQRLMLASG